IQHSPVGSDVLHIDFHAVSMDETIQADVPLEALGIATGVKNFGGLLEQSLRSLAVECLPRDLPDRITVDVSNLNIGDSIHVRDIQMPKDVTPKVPLELTVFSVLAPVVEEEPVPVAAEGEEAGRRSGRSGRRLGKGKGCGSSACAERVCAERACSEGKRAEKVTVN